MAAPEVAEQYEIRLSGDSELPSEYDLEASQSAKHDSLPFVLDPINLSLDPIRFSFFGGISAFGDKDDDLLKKLSFEPIHELPAESTHDSSKETVREEAIPPAHSEHFTLAPAVYSKPTTSAKTSRDLASEPKGKQEERQEVNEVEINVEFKIEGTAEVREQMGDISSKESNKPVSTMNNLNVPKHPIASMQAAFAESMYEAASETPSSKTKSTVEDAVERRIHLLTQGVSEPTYAARWKQKPGQNFHQLWKLVAQISFGSYLLFASIAKNEDDVLSILQGHVDEVDEFLESTLQDFDHAQEDIDERLRCLKVPMENVEVFDQMLTDRGFRTSIVNGNEQIEHVITRTASAMNDALKDVQQGISATKDFAIWLSEVQRNPRWTDDKPAMQQVYDAMKGNAEGWYMAFLSLQTKGNHLSIALVQLGSIVAEMDKRAGEVSRRMRFSDAHIVPKQLASPPQSPPDRSVSYISDASNSTSHTGKGKSKEYAGKLVDYATLSPSTYSAGGVRTPVPESDTEPEHDTDSEPEILLQPTVFTLQPRVYSPAPCPARSPKASPELQEVVSQKSVSPPPLKQRSSLRQRFSLRRKQTPPVVAPPAVAPPAVAPPSRRPALSPVHQSPPVMPSPRNQSVSSNTSPRQPSIASFNHQSAIYSNRQASSSSHRIPSAALTFAIPNSPHASLHNDTGAFGGYRAADDPQLIPSQLPTPVGSQSLHDSYFPSHINANTSHMTSPRGDQQTFRPVFANPNSPLQRPWTAAPEGQMQHQMRHSQSNQMLRNSAGGLGIQNGTHMRDPNSLTANRGQSTLNRTTMASSMRSESGMSGYTVGVDGEGKKIKKKKSGFGWLKKAFSLSEEERLAFEERRRRTEFDQGYGGNGGYGYREAPKFLDGKRIR